LPKLADIRNDIYIWFSERSEFRTLILENKFRFVTVSELVHKLDLLVNKPHINPDSAINMYMYTCILL